MPENYQMLFNIAITLVGFLGGWVLNSLKSSIEALQKADASLTKEVQKIEVLVAGQYVRKEDFDRLGEAIFEKLDRIYEKLDKKADK